MSLQEEVRSYLESLGETSDEIYRTLKYSGIVGKRGSSLHCPVAQAIFREFGKDAFVTHDQVLVMTGEEGQTVLTTQAVSDFVIAFDMQQYSDLDVEAKR